MHFFSDLRRVLTDSKTDRIAIIYLFTTHKKFPNFKWSRFHKMMQNIIEHMEIVPDNLVWLVD